MQCPNCGAELTGEELCCPYCGWENQKLAEEHQQKKIASIYNKAADLFRLPEQMVKKIFHRILIAAGAGLALYVVILIIISISNAVRVDNSYRIQQENLEKLESYYQTGEFEEMHDYLYTIDGYYSATYHKYYIIGTIADTYSYTRKNLEELRKYDVKYLTDGEILIYDLYALLNRLADICELEEKGFVYGEKEVALDFKEKITALLHDELYLTDEEIEGAIPIAKDKAKLTALAEESLRRMKEERTQ